MARGFSVCLRAQASLPRQASVLGGYLRGFYVGMKGGSSDTPFFCFGVVHALDAVVASGVFRLYRWTRVFYWVIAAYFLAAA